MPQVIEPTANVHAPAKVLAGPYRMVFDNECGQARYGAPGAGDSHGYLYTVANFSLVRPPGSWKRVVCLTRTPKILPDSLGGESFGTLVGPKPGWRDSFSFTSSVPAGWRGTLLEVEGELRETAAEKFEARFSGVRIARLNGIDRRASVVIQVPQTVRLAHGVRVTLRSQPSPMATLPLTIEWDERAVAPDREGGPVTLENIETNVAWGSGFQGERSSGQSKAIRLDLGELRVPEGEQDVRVTMTLAKTLRAHPCRIPLTLEWNVMKGN